jgi:hypothetical protein
LWVVQVEAMLTGVNPSSGKGWAGGHTSESRGTGSTAAALVEELLGTGLGGLVS